MSVITNENIKELVVEYMKYKTNEPTRFPPIHTWDVSQVTNMAGLFQGMTEFNEPLNDWNVHNVIDMENMFLGATSFNQPLDKWDVSNLKYADNMFLGATHFDQDLSNWHVNLYNIHGMFDANYDTHKMPIPTITSYEMFYNPRKHDSTYQSFHHSMKYFRNKRRTIYNYNKYINDSMLSGITNPYLVHYETYNGRAYPIVSILKGTLLFTARVHLSDSIHSSYFHLYKLAGNSSLHDYTKDDCENALTYFYPVPYMASVITSQFRTMDMVVLQKDIKLLCLISPSPIDRSIKNEKMDVRDPYTNDIYYDNNDLKPCEHRDYDICLSNEVIRALKLNGYIGISYSDSLSVPSNLFKVKDPFFRDFRQSLVYLSSCFNNGIYPKRVKIAGDDPLGDRFVDKMIYERTYGIPEVALFPYDFHTYPDDAEYTRVYNRFQENVNANTNNIIADENHFLFKHVDHVVGRDTIDVAMNMGDMLDEKYRDNIGKSLQCYPLLNVFNDEVDIDKMHYVVDFDYSISYNDIAFVNSYNIPSYSKSAFETVIFYEMLDELQTRSGGYAVEVKEEESQFLPNIQNRKAIKDTQPRMNKTKDVYYREVNGIPILAFYKDKPNTKKRKRGGRKSKKQKRSRRHRRKTRRMRD